MPIDPTIPMRTREIDTATPVYNAREQDRQDQIAAQQILSSELENMNTREKSRLTSVIAGAAQLKPFLDNEDLQGAQNFLTRRRSEIQNMQRHGLQVDTQDTDAALEMLAGGRVDELKQNVQGLLAAGQVYGLLGTPSDTAGGSTGVLLDRLVAEQRAGGNKNYSLQDALQELKGGAGQSGKNLANIDTGYAANYATQSGQNASDLVYKPAIASQTATQTETGQRLGENIADYTDFRAAIPQLEQTVNKLYDVAGRADYTKTAQTINSFQRQFGFDPGDDASARVYYQNLVRDEILPLLKPTFGAAFTVTEGEWLLGTLGDPNLSPPEKRAAIQARVDSWQNLAKTMATRAGMQAPDNMFSSFPPNAGGGGQKVRVTHPQTGETYDIDPSDLQSALQEGFVQR